MNTYQIKENAKNLLKRNHWACVLVALLMGLGGSAITGVNGGIQGFFSSSYGDSQIPPFWENLDLFLTLLLAFVFVITAAVSILLTVFVFNQFKVGGARYFLKYRRNIPVEISEIFQSYKDKTFLNVAKTTLMKDLSIFLWSLLCFIPGVYKAYEYWAVEYIVAVRPTIHYSEALNLSKKIMNGHKLELFTLQLSFIGWFLLNLFTCNLLNILYISPYLQLSYAEFFSFVRVDALGRNAITIFDVPDYENYMEQHQFNNGAFMGTSDYTNADFGFNNVNNIYNQPYNEAQAPNATGEAFGNFTPNPQSFDSFANSMPTHKSNPVPTMENDIAQNSGEYKEPKLNTDKGEYTEPKGFQNAQPYMEFNEKNNIDTEGQDSQNNSSEEN